MASCPRCGAESEEQAQFCEQCGEAVAQPASVEASGAAEAPPVVSVSRPIPPDRQASQGLPIPENIAAVIGYLTIIPAIVFVYLEPFKRNPFVRFHAFQHIFLFVAASASAVAAFIVWMVLQLVPFMRVLVFPFAGLIGLAWFFLWLLLVTKAYHHEMFKLPWIGDLAEEYMNR